MSNRSNSKLLRLKSAYQAGMAALALASTVAAFACLGACLALPGCSQGESADGASFTPANSIQGVTFDASAAEEANGAKIDTSHAQDGYVAVSATNSQRLKLQISMGDASTNFDIPQDGTPAYCPLTQGNGTYTIRVMQNTTGNSYVELLSTQADVTLTDEFAPFTRPNIYCNYSENSACVAKARELVQNAQNEGEALEAICNYVVQNITYDDDKANQLKSATGYVPDPDETLSSGTGICFDYASLGAAMLRSQGIPTKIVTGYVSPGNIYHAWIMVYIDGTWKSAQFSVDSKTWSRVDLTFAASSGNENVGDGKSYTDRYVY